MDRVFLEVAGVDEPSLLREDLNRSRDLSEDRAVLKKFFSKKYFGQTSSRFQS